MSCADCHNTMQQVSTEPAGPEEHFGHVCAVPYGSAPTSEAFARCCRKAKLVRRLLQPARVVDPRAPERRFGQRRLLAATRSAGRALGARPVRKNCVNCHQPHGSTTTSCRRRRGRISAVLTRRSDITRRSTRRRTPRARCRAEGRVHASSGAPARTAIRRFMAATTRPAPGSSAERR